VQHNSDRHTGLILQDNITPPAHINHPQPGTSDCHFTCAVTYLLYIPALVQGVIFSKNSHKFINLVKSSQSTRQT